MSWVFVVSPATLGTTVHINLRTVLAFALLMKRLLRLTISRATLAASKDIQRKQWISILEAFGVFEQCCKCGTPITRHANLFSIPGNLQENCAVLESLALEEPFQAGWKSCWLVVEWWILVVKNCKKALKSEGIHTSANPKTVPKHAESVVQCHTPTDFSGVGARRLLRKDLAASGAGLQCRSEVLFTNQRVQATGSPNRSAALIYDPKARTFIICQHIISTLFSMHDSNTMMYNITTTTCKITSIVVIPSHTSYHGV